MTDEPELKLEDLKKALEDIEGICENTGSADFDMAMTQIGRVSHAALNPIVEPTPYELKAAEIADFVMSEFQLAFASVETITEAVNDKGIKTINKKVWSKANMAKIMILVKEIIVDRIGNKYQAADPVGPEVINTTVSNPNTYRAPEVIIEMDEMDEMDEINHTLETIRELDSLS